ncbi:MAG: 3-dehydroquinate synthase family protein, partial [Alphaproteobacteria bacterium]
MTPVPTRATIRVELGAGGYDVIVGPGLLAEAARHLRPVIARPVVFLVTDAHVAALHAETLEAVLAQDGIRVHRVTVAPGEASKSFGPFARLLDDLLDAGCERTDTIVALGGGVVGDLAGFAAAVLRRGVPFVQMPTTLLAQVDSAIGGKTGIDTRHGKNLVGAFHQPTLVLADTAVLATLPARELCAGYAEVVKYGLMGDAGFFAWLEAHGAEVLAGADTARSHAIATSCRIKARIVAADERDSGERALLNLGHT